MRHGGGRGESSEHFLVCTEEQDVARRHLRQIGQPSRHTHELGRSGRAHDDRQIRGDEGHARFHIGENRLLVFAQLPCLEEKISEYEREDGQHRRFDTLPSLDEDLHRSDSF